MYKNLARVRIWRSKVKGQGHQRQKNEIMRYFVSHKCCKMTYFISAIERSFIVSCLFGSFRCNEPHSRRVNTTQPGSVTLMSVFCWIVIHQRINDNLDWELPWADYKAGFGSIDSNFWLGLENMHLLTSSQPYRLMTEYVDRSYVASDLVL